jgi:hypothetical protein
MPLHYLLFLLPTPSSSFLVFLLCVCAVNRNVIPLHSVSDTTGKGGGDLAAKLISGSNQIGPHSELERNKYATL